MPTYEYSCPKCGQFEVIQKITESALSACPTCGSPVQRLVSAAAFHLKGSGWYKTDYASGKSSGGSSPVSSEPASSAKPAESKPASDSGAATSGSSTPAAAPSSGAAASTPPSSGSSSAKPD